MLSVNVVEPDHFGIKFVVPDPQILPEEAVVANISAKSRPAETNPPLAAIADNPIALTPPITVSFCGGLDVPIPTNPASSKIICPPSLSTNSAIG